MGARLGCSQRGWQALTPGWASPWEGPGAAGRWDTAPRRGYPSAACAVAGVKQPQPAQMRAGAQGQAGHCPQGVSQSHRPGYHVPTPAAPRHRGAEVPHVVPVTRRCHKHQGCRPPTGTATDCSRAWSHISTPSHGEKQNKPRTPRRSTAVQYRWSNGACPGGRGSANRASHFPGPLWDPH